MSGSEKMEKGPMEILLEKLASDMDAAVEEEGIVLHDFLLENFKRRLLPLLEAGERMYENCPIDALAVAWFSAKRAAREQS